MIGSVRCVVGRALGVLALLVVVSGSAAAATRAEFDAFTNRFLDDWYAARPVQATMDGLHAHDARLGLFSRDDIETEIARLRKAQADLTALAPAGLDSARIIDREYLLGRIDAEILRLDTLREWEKDPGWYLEIITDGLESLLDGAPATAERLTSIVAREKAAGAVLAAAFENVYNPPGLWVEAADERARGTIAWLKETLPVEAAAGADAAQRAEFDQVNAGLIRDLESFQSYLGQGLMPAAHGAWAIGADNLQRWLRSAEVTDVPLYRLLRLGQEEIKNLQIEFKSAAAAVDPNRPPEEVLRILSIDHSDVKNLTRDAAVALNGLRGDRIAASLLTMPTPESCEVRLTPLFARGEQITRLRPAGVFESKLRRHRLELTPPDPSLPPTEQDDQLRPFNRYALPLLLLSDGWPGRLAQAQIDQRVASRVRRALPAATATLGWSAYVEKKMVQDGWGSSDAGYRFFLTHRALIRAGLGVAAIRLHSGEMTVDQAVDFLATEARLAKPLARREVRRLTRDWNAAADLIGQFEIDKLREDYRRHQGNAWSAKTFHDRLLALGPIPLKLARALLMPGDKGTLL